MQLHWMLSHTGLKRLMPDEMRRIVFIISSLIMISEVCPAQTYTDVMSRLMNYALELRTDGSDDIVYEKLQRDDKWTLMNEVADDLGGQCSLRERIGRFGINDLAIKIEEKNRGKFESAGLFCNGTDPKYDYSFIEKSVKAGKSVNYIVPGREGMQQFVIVPFEKGKRLQAKALVEDASYDFSIDSEGNYYVSFSVSKGASITLTVSEADGSASAFVIINYNSKK